MFSLSGGHISAARRRAPPAPDPREEPRAPSENSRTRQNRAGRGDRSDHAARCCGAGLPARRRGETSGVQESNVARPRWQRARKTSRSYAVGAHNAPSRRRGGARRKSALAGRWRNEWFRARSSTVKLSPSRCSGSAPARRRSRARSGPPAEAAHMRGLMPSKTLPIRSFLAKLTSAPFERSTLNADSDLCDLQ